VQTDVRTSSVDSAIFVAINRDAFMQFHAGKDVKISW